MAPATYNPTWWERATNPDLVTRGLNVGSGPPTVAPDPTAPPPASAAAAAPWLTQPSQRPFVYQRFLSFNVIANTPSVQIANFRLEVEAIIFNVYSTGALSVFWGPAGVTTATGIEVQPGVPAPLSIDQAREQWELQRSLEHIAALLAIQSGNQPLAAYKAPRVVFDLSTIWLASTAAQAVTVMAFLPPELQ